ncbi:inositol-tetrakisphosphate 1-kinase 6-like isoform X2 [Zea mays]|uniref:inositol-tetrakisphosphate 1-kinase 6-like isoform X2 n=1 Tax=Zea mays TaxID=4577 RepID=UPI000C6C47C6|nr:inositol-tetrakisphosphate 1-kinase 6-like isoform X2 [Zea mays]XP_023155856.1 inositol-tetrakisphosphate 1-kinase 6-like isoform X2 [Zea mays]|eukprot:XP_023155854.1 inositol-tetrakisphosphate 1-kinase 6-like isoform X2 [Zea mays]
MATGRPVRLVLDASLLLDPSSTREAAAAALRPGVEELRRRLRYSNLTVAICYAEGMPTNEELCDSSVLVIGYIMKKSREEDFARASYFRV